MKIPKFWAKARFPGKLPNAADAATAWGWSDISQDDAHADALARAQRISALFSSGEDRDWNSLQYEYTVHPLREEILETHQDDHGKTIALVTRNRYGALVLNSPSVCFVDIDFPEPTTLGMSFFQSLKFFFTSGARAKLRDELKQSTIDSISAWSAQNPRRSFRLYRTAAGLRLLFTDGLYDPLSHDTAQLFKAFNTDPLYRALTRKQECFRARLTPKPWRCGIPPIASNHAFSQDNSNLKLQQWLADYDNAAKKFGVCSLLQTFGKPANLPEIHRILALHDAHCLKPDNLPLA